MRSIYLLAFCLSLFCLAASGQPPKLEKETWAETAIYHPVESKYAGEPAYLIYDHRKVEYVDMPGNEVQEYYSLHRIIHVNDDHGIEYFNKVYISVSDFSDVVQIRARTILPGGKVINLDTANIKDLKDEDGTLYKIFAMEGVEKGCEVEYDYTTKINTSYFGKVVIQDKFPVMETRFDLIAPDRLVFDTKIYNCTGLQSTDSLPGEKSILTVRFKETAGAEKEKYSSYRVNLSRVEYKLSYNNATHKGERLFTWNELSKRYYAMYSGWTEKELKKMTALAEDNHWNQLTDDSVKVTKVENYIKKNIIFRNDLEGDDITNVDMIMKTKLANSQGLMRFYSALFTVLQVDFQYVLGGDRDDEMIDRTFENWNNCNYPMFYFPSLHAYIAPTRTAFRYPYIDPSWGNANALFCKTVSIGSMNSAIAEIKRISLVDYQRTYNNLDSRLSVNTAMDSLMIDMKLILGGYSAAYYRQNFDFMKPDQKRDAIKEITKGTLGSESISFYELQNEHYEEGNTSKPFILHVKVSSGDLIEKAGNKILLKIGLVIGPQVEMYQEKVRRLPITMEFGNIQQRRIELLIPDGYSIKNPQDLKIEQVFQENGIQTMGFVSGYEINGNVLTVLILEEYRNTFYPISQYEEFRKIINASSDFNKVVLVLEKKK